jgi:transcriptional regulator with XRE-family HTH domain
MISENIKILRKKRGLTQTELANQLGVNRPLIASYEEGRAEPKLQLITKLCDYFNINVDDFLNKSFADKAAYQWIAFDFNVLETRPKKYGKYLICRKDGKIHWETWNGSGWAYNHNEIRFYAKITNPILNHETEKV